MPLPKKKQLLAPRTLGPQHNACRQQLASAIGQPAVSVGRQLPSVKRQLPSLRANRRCLTESCHQLAGFNEEKTRKCLIPKGQLCSAFG
jgi:hypothetical protein